MRDYLIVLMVLMTLPVGLVRPFYGLLVYAWLSYMSPHTFAWSFALTFPVAKLSALSVFGGCAISPPRNAGSLFTREALTMCLLWGVFTVSSVFAVYPVAAWDYWQDVSKVIAMALLTAVLVTESWQLRYLLLVIAFSIGFYGFKGGLFALATGGVHRVWGPDNTILFANNSIGLALNVCLPLFWYLAQEEQGWIKRALQAMFLLTIPAVMFTYSRASFLAMVVVLGAIALKSRRRILLAPAAIAVALLAAPLMPQQFVERVETVRTYEEDASSMSRIDNWRFVWRLAVDRPLAGAGFAFSTEEMFRRYAPEFLLTYGGSTWNTHSIYFSILGSHGFPGLAGFLGMIAFALLSCSWMKGAVRKRPELRWIGTYSDMFQVGFLGYMVNGAFVNMEYFDLPYQLVAMVASMKVICQRELASAEKGETGELGRQLVTEGSVAIVGT